jgi:ATP-dependent DNA helicase RecQ
MTADTNTSVALEVLKKYWGYESFRTPQLDIIKHVLKSKNTLALLPTGGGKSVCFQVPGLILDGITLVVSPLIALMLDQVEQLQRRGIKAEAIVSGMHKREIDIVLDNCVHGHVKFLYVSPERLKSELMISRLERMQISLLAIDEAHCISQWGYDFRPEYLEIAEIRPIIGSDIPIIALTASATPKIQDDILLKLGIENALVFRKSFGRPNLSYRCTNTDEKIKVVSEVLNKTGGSSIIYVRNRRKTQDISNKLNKLGIRSAFYHAGLSSEIRNKTQDSWIKNKHQVIVATNAFGMGIDKPDVRHVFHFDLPDSLEAYYQEAGRAGRDENFAEARILFTELDLAELKKRTESRFPDLSSLKQSYTAICNSFQLALGSGELEQYALDLFKVSQNFDISQTTLYYSIKEIEKHGYWRLEENSSSKSQLLFLIDNRDIYSFQVANPKYDLFIKVLIRIYGGQLFTHFTNINEDQIAQKAVLDHNQVIDKLKTLNELGIVQYQAKSDKPRLIFTKPRQNISESFISTKDLEEDREKYFRRMNQILNYVKIEKSCRSNFIQDYFGEGNLKECGICDNCIKRKSFDKINLRGSILTYIRTNGPIGITGIFEEFIDFDQEKIKTEIRELHNDGLVDKDQNNQLIVK